MTGTPSHPEWHSLHCIEHWTRFGPGGAASYDIISLLPAPNGRPLQILEVAGGHGWISSHILNARPDIRVRFLGPSNTVTDVVRTVLAPFRNRVVCRTANSDELCRMAELAHRFDVVVVSLWIWSATGIGVGSRTYAYVAPLVRPGGTLLGLECAAGSSDFLAPHLAQRLRWLDRNGFASTTCIRPSDELTVLRAIRLRDKEQQ